MRIDPTRHLDTFDPIAFGRRPIHVIGCGAIGSKVALSIAKLGVENLHLWDFDRIEAHNVPNQVFGLPHVGQLKVDVLGKLLEAYAGCKAQLHPVKVDGSQPLSGTVFLCVDSMGERSSDGRIRGGRWEIWERGIRRNPAVEWLVEARIGVDSVRLYGVDPNNDVNVQRWEDAWYPDSETAVPVSACGASQTVGPTAGLAADLAVWLFLSWLRKERNRQEPIANEVILGCRGVPAVYAETWPDF